MIKRQLLHASVFTRKETPSVLVRFLRAQGSCDLSLQYSHMYIIPLSKFYQLVNRFIS